MEQPRERCGQPPGPLGVGDGVLEAQREQRVGLPDLGLRAVGEREQPHRAQLAVDQALDVGLGDRAAEALADPGGDLGVAAAPVDGLEDQVEQAGQLDGLPVGTTGGEITFAKGISQGYLPQDGLAHAGRTILDEASSAFASCSVFRSNSASSICRPMSA